MKRQWVMVIALLATLLAGCGGGATTTAPPPAERTAEATAPPTEPPPPEGPRATIVDVVNEVDAHALPEETWIDAQVDMTIYLGGEVWAKEASTARVGLEESLVRVAPNTIFTLAQPDPDTVQLNLEDGQVWVNVEGLGPGETFQVETPTAVASVRGTRFSVRTTPEGGTVISVREGTVVVSAAGTEVEVKAGEEVEVPPEGPPGQPRPMSLQEQIRWGMAADGNLNTVLPAFGEPSWITQTGYASHPQCSPDGQYLAYFYYRESADKGYVLYDREAGSFLEPLWPEDTWWMDLHPYENLIAYNTGFEIGTANLEDGSIVSYFMLPDGSLYGTPYWSPDGEWLLFQGEIGAPSRSHVFKAHPDGSELTQLTSGEGDFTHPVWSPDGNSIAYLRSEQPGDSAELWVISADGDPQAVITDTHFVPWMYPVWSPDGSMLAAAGYGEGEYGTEGGLWVIPLDDGGTPWMVPGTEGLTAVNPVWYTDGWPMWDLWILPPGTELPEGEGWPLFFEARGEDGGGLWWYAPGLTESAAFYSSAAWGPIWCPEGENVLFGYTEGTEEERLTTIYSFPLISVP